MRVILKDIAIEAGVSKGKVSRVLNNDLNVSYETRIKMEELIAKYNYQPYKIASCLARNLSQTIEVMVPEADKTVQLQIIFS